MAIEDYYRRYNSDTRLPGQFSGVMRGDFVRADLLRELDASLKGGFDSARKFVQLKLDDSYRGLDVITAESLSSRSIDRVRSGGSVPSSVKINVNAPDSFKESCAVNIGDHETPDIILSPSLDRTPSPSWIRELFEDRPWLGWSSNPGEVQWPHFDPLEFSPPSVAVMIPIFNKPDRFVACLESIENETIYPNVSNVYIVNDGSDEYSSGLIESIAKRNGWVVISHENHGYLYSANKGISQAFHDGADYVVSCNSDILVTRGWLSGMVRAALRNNAALVNPLCNQQALISLPMSVEKAHGMRRLAGGVSYISAAIAASIVPPSYPDAVTSVGNCLLIERELWSDHGPFNADIYGTGYGEECELWALARKDGKRCVVADDVYVYHESHGTMENASDRERDGARAFLKRWRPLYMREIVKMRLWDKKMDAVRSVASSMNPHEIPIRFICFNIGPYGGVYCIVRLVNELAKRGFCPSIDYVVQQPHDFKMIVGPRKHNNAASLRTIGGEEASQQGFIVATHWFTGEILNTISSDNSNIIPLAFWQDREDLFTEPNGSISLRQGSIDIYPTVPNRVVNARWVGETAQDDLGISAFTHIPVGVDCHKFYPGEKRESRIKIVSMHRPSTPRRGAKRLQRLYHNLRERYGDTVSLETFGEPCSFADVHHGKVSQDKVAQIMRDASIVVEPSDFQGFGLPGLEGMASGCALVSTDNLGVHEYGIHGQNCFIANKDEDLLGHLYELIENPDLVDRLGEHGRETALSFDWSIIADKWADHLRDIYSKSGFTKYA